MAFFIAAVFASFAVDYETAKKESEKFLTDKNSCGVSFDFTITGTDKSLHGNIFFRPETVKSVMLLTGSDNDSNKLNILSFNIDVSINQANNEIASLLNFPSGLLLEKISSISYTDSVLYVTVALSEDDF